jgi:hypothetical protein
VVLEGPQLQLVDDNGSELMAAPQHQPVELRAECEREQRVSSSVDGFLDEMEPWRLILSVSLAWCVAYESHPSTTFVA